MNPGLYPLQFRELPGWRDDDHEAALACFRRSCREIGESGSAFSRSVHFGGSLSAWRETCSAALQPVDAREFFERRFRPFRVIDAETPDGCFTGYFEPIVDGSRQPSADFHVPIYRRPDDLIAFDGEHQLAVGLDYGRISAGIPKPYFERREIEEGALKGRGLELVWLRSWVDAFFIHIQGSGRVRLPDGSSMRLSYAAKSGLPYTGIGGLLVERGVFCREALSMQAIRRWMADHPEQARGLMWENRSFVFFREAHLDDPLLGAFGAQHVQLTPRRSLAVDRALWMFGTPVWLDMMVPTGEEGGMRRFQHLLVAQDTGSAIKGAARGDVYWGFGEEAGRIAGPMKSPGAMTVLLPIPVADELGLSA